MKLKKVLKMKMEVAVNLDETKYYGINEEDDFSGSF